jgi:hypothetical protein
MRDSSSGNLANLLATFGSIPLFPPEYILGMPLTDGSPMNETGFEDVGLGDKVWDVRYGWGVITDLIGGLFNVEFKGLGKNETTTVSYDRNGVIVNRNLKIKTRTLFWNEVKSTNWARPGPPA